jgi:hypothetical protein
MTTTSISPLTLKQVRTWMPTSPDIFYSSVTQWGSRAGIVWTEVPFLRFWIYWRSLLLLHLCRLLLQWEWERRWNWRWEFKMGGLEVIGMIGEESCPLEFCGLLHHHPLLQWREAICLQQRPLIGVWWVFHFSSLFYLHSNFYCSFLFLPFCFLYEELILLPWNSSIRIGDKLSSFQVYLLCTHQVIKSLTISKFLHLFASSNRFVVIVRTLCNLHLSSSHWWHFSFFSVCSVLPAQLLFTFYHQLHLPLFTLSLLLLSLYLCIPHNSIPTMYLYLT